MSPVAGSATDDLKHWTDVVRGKGRTKLRGRPIWANTPKDAATATI